MLFSDRRRTIITQCNLRYFILPYWVCLDQNGSQDSQNMDRIDGKMLNCGVVRKLRIVISFLKLPFHQVIFNFVTESVFLDLPGGPINSLKWIKPPVSWIFSWVCKCSGNSFLNVFSIKWKQWVIKSWKFVTLQTDLQNTHLASYIRSFIRFFITNLRTFPFIA